MGHSIDFWDLVRQRHSVRKYDPAEEVSPEEVQRILETAIRAPSAGNQQPWHFVVVRDQALRERLYSEAAPRQKLLTLAPVVVAVCCEPARAAERYGGRGANLYCLQDTAVATGYMLLAATALGLGCCWVGSFDEAAVAGILELPEHLRPVAMVAIGHPSPPSTSRRSRRPLDEVVTYR
jgi:nitroreductase